MSIRFRNNLIAFLVVFAAFTSAEPLPDSLKGEEVEEAEVA